VLKILVKVLRPHLMVGVHDRACEQVAYALDAVSVGIATSLFLNRVIYALKRGVFVRDPDRRITSLGSSHSNEILIGR
jgi:hypothetical protein